MNTAQKYDELISMMVPLLYNAMCCSNNLLSDSQILDQEAVPRARGQPSPNGVPRTHFAPFSNKVSPM